MRAYPRPFPPPARPWVMAQTWHDLLFMHWRVPAGALRLPSGLTLDTFEGAAWVGVVPLHMSGVRLRGLPPMPGTGAFPELNVRTYVKHGDVPGVWFYSLDAGHPLMVEIARAWYHLPYFHARMRVRRDGDALEYASMRADGRAAPGVLRVRYRPTGAPFSTTPGTLAHWLTARFALYAADRRGGLYRGDIAHAPWALQPAEAELLENSVPHAHGITLPDAPPLLHFARALSIAAWTLERV